MRKRAVRRGVPGGGDGAQRRRAERHGVQPLHRHALLLEQLSLQSAALQFPALRGLGNALAQAAAQPGGHGAESRRDGKVHLLRAAHQQCADRIRETEPADPRRRDRHGLPGLLPHRSHRFWECQRSREPRRPAQGPAAQLRNPGGPEHAAAHHVSRRGAESKPRAGEGGKTMSAGRPINPGTPARRSAPVLAPGYTVGSVTAKISAIVLTRPTTRGWWLGFGASFLIVMLLLYTISYLLAVGTGIWGIDIPVGWGFAIVNFVWWIGIGHAGTLISAILLLLNQKWRTSINRFAEAMTLFAVASAGLFPLLHLGRPGLFYWLLPYPSTMGVWPQFRSPLVWDVFAVATYFTVSLLFWFVGLIPDLATLRDRSTSRLGRIAYGVLAMGWRGSAIHWHRYDTAYLLLAGLATPLVVSVHTVVSFDFAVAIVPGWHTTIFPPYFVAGAIYSGFAMVLTLAIPIRAVYGLEDFITMRHLQNMAKVMLATGLIVAYGYLMENFMSWYSAEKYEKSMTLNRWVGPYAPVYWALILVNVIIPQ